MGCGPTKTIHNNTPKVFIFLLQLDQVQFEEQNPVNEKALKPEPELTIEAKAKVLMEAEPKIIINPVTEPKIESESIPVLEHSNNSTNPPIENNETKNPV